MHDLLEFERKQYSMVLKCRACTQRTENESRFSTATSTSFSSEFNTNSEYVIFFFEYFRQKNGLVVICPRINVV
jgi:hypothetical protein